ncbi:collagen-like protein [Streptomyces sp. NPDC002088]|uniref:collagen-like protein n=1 Tax=Streptomyces sp. NPDC002088 TaxID=3154665 RepID=UPI00331EE564
MSRVQIRAEERRWRRGDVLVVTAALLFGTALAWILLSVQSLNHDLETSNQARDALARQVQGLGGTPVAGPPGSRGEPGESVTGPPGTQGETGPSGPPGPSGSSGTNGKDGAAGETGAPGTPGQDGAPGADSTVPGPQGPQGETGPAGPQGEQGEQGPKGDTGEQGPAGPSCPDGYSLQAPVYDPDALVCRRDTAPTDDKPGNGNGNGSLAMALDPQRRQYS